MICTSGSGRCYHAPPRDSQSRRRMEDRRRCQPEWDGLGAISRGERKRRARRSRCAESRPVRAAARLPSSVGKTSTRAASSTCGRTLSTRLRCQLDDPDGGSAERTVHARTRSVPLPAAARPVRKVSMADLATAQPGEILLLAAGNYGAFVVPRDGEPGRPIVFRSGDGSAQFSSISVRDRKHIHFEGLTIKNTDQRAAGIDLFGAEHCAVNAVYGIRAARPPGATECYTRRR